MVTDSDMQMRERWLPLLYKIAHRYSQSYRQLPKDDIVQAGYLGLDKACNEWTKRQSAQNNSNSSSLIQYLSIGISNTITQAIRQSFPIHYKCERRKIKDIAKDNYRMVSIEDVRPHRENEDNYMPFEVVDAERLSPDRVCEINDHQEYLENLIHRLAIQSSPKAKLPVERLEQIIKLYLQKEMYTKISRVVGVKRTELARAITAIRFFVLDNPVYKDLHMRPQNKKPTIYTGSGIYKYVTFAKGAYRVCISISEKLGIQERVSLGGYRTAKDAGHAVDHWIRTTGRTNIQLNFPDEPVPEHVKSVYDKHMHRYDRMYVTYHCGQKNPWAVIVKKCYVGLFPTLESAIKERDAWIKAHGGVDA